VHSQCIKDTEFFLPFFFGPVDQWNAERSGPADESELLHGEDLGGAAGGDDVAAVEIEDEHFLDVPLDLLWGVAEQSGDIIVNGDLGLAHRTAPLVR
jgi:hypothetical protein